MNKVGVFLSRTVTLILGSIVGILIIGCGVFTIYFIIVKTIPYFHTFPIPNFPGFLGIAVFVIAPVGLILGPLILLDIMGDVKKLFFRKKCSICTKIAYDTLSGDKKIGEFCRQHLLEKYSQYFITSPFNVVMIEFQPKGLSSPAYLYYPVSEIDFSGRYSNKDDFAAQDTIRHFLEIIKTEKCERCSERASILFTSKEDHPYGKYSTTPRRQILETKGKYFCKKHALEKVIPALKNSSKNFDTYEGLCVPFKEDGYQATIEF